MAKAREKRSWFRRIVGDDKASGKSPPQNTSMPIAPAMPAAPAPPVAPAPVEPVAAQAIAALSSPAPVEPVAAEATAAPSSSLEASLAALTEGAAYVHRFDETSQPHHLLSPLSHRVVDGALRLADGDPKATPGSFVGGFNIRLPDEIEKAASGRAITVRWLARSPDAPEARAACAYSTNEVGNSGWRWESFGPEWKIARFDYKVAPMVKGNGDFVGLLPAASGEPAIEIAGLAIDIAP